jgi:hypothetical protein
MEGQIARRIDRRRRREDDGLDRPDRRAAVEQRLRSGDIDINRASGVGITRRDEVKRGKVDNDARAIGHQTLRESVRVANIPLNDPHLPNDRRREVRGCAEREIIEDDNFVPIRDEPGADARPDEPAPPGHKHWINEQQDFLTTPPHRTRMNVTAASPSLGAHSTA